MSNYNRKKVLYDKIDKIREFLGIKDSHYPLDVVDLCIKNNVATVEKVPFKSIMTRGMAIPYVNDEKDIILLNSFLSKMEQSFSCGHEIVHLTCHRSTKDHFFSFKNIKPNQNPYLEWQANEGSAELHVPYRLLLAEIKKSYPTLKSWHDIQNFKSKLAEDFQVVNEVIYYRLESLKYEIHQYLNGIEFGEIEFLSTKKQIEVGINIQSINDIQNELQKNPPLPVAPEKDGHYQQG